MTKNSIDDYLSLLSDPHRRTLLQQLRHDFAGEATIDELADGLFRADSDAEAGTNEVRKRHAIQLHHNHLPRLAAHDVVEYDPDSSTVRYQSHETFEAVLDSLPGKPSTVTP